MVSPAQLSHNLHREFRSHREEGMKQGVGSPVVPWRVEPRVAGNLLSGFSPHARRNETLGITKKAYGMRSLRSKPLAGRNLPSSRATASKNHSMTNRCSGRLPLCLCRRRCAVSWREIAPGFHANGLQSRPSDVFESLKPTISRTGGVALLWLSLIISSASTPSENSCTPRMASRIPPSRSGRLPMGP